MTARTFENSETTGELKMASYQVFKTDCVGRDSRFAIEASDDDMAIVAISKHSGAFITLVQGNRRVFKGKIDSELVAS